jgi:hypothetical protein
MTVRAWNRTTVELWRGLVGRRAVARVQSNWAYASLFGWVRVVHITLPAPPGQIVTSSVLQKTGCSHLTAEQYIHEFCSEKQEDGTSAVVAEVVAMEFEFFRPR